MAGRGVPSCPASDKISKQRLSMPASQQRVRIEWWQVISRQCGASKLTVWNSWLGQQPGLTRQNSNE